MSTENMAKDLNTYRAGPRGEASKQATRKITSGTTVLQRSISPKAPLKLKVPPARKRTTS